MKEFISPRHAILAALCFSLTALAAAYGAEYFAGIKPCALCHYQRYFQFGAVAICGLALLSRTYFIGVFAVGTTYLANAGMAFYQVLVEKKIVPLPASCHAPALNYDDFDQFKQQMLENTHVACDHVTWSFFGISLAGYGAIFTVIAGVACLIVGMMSTKSYRTSHGS